MTVWHRSFTGFFSALARVWKELIVGVMAAALLLFVADAGTQVAHTQYRAHRIGTFLLQKDVERLGHLRERAMAGDAAAAVEAKMIRDAVATYARGMMSAGPMTMRGSRIDALVEGTIRVVSLLLMGGVLLSLFLYTLLTVMTGKTPIAALRRMRSLLVPAAFVSLLMLFCSALWIPLLFVLTLRLSISASAHVLQPIDIGVVLFGYSIAIAVGPRLFLAPFFLLQRGSKPIDAIRQSVERTNGWWGFVLGRIILAASIVLIVRFLLLSALKPLLLAAFPEPALLFASWILTSAAFTMFVCACVRLAATVDDGLVHSSLADNAASAAPVDMAKPIVPVLAPAAS